MQEEKTRRSNKSRTEATRAALIRAARALFVEKGFAETGTPDIVKAAQVTRGALYHHFADKTDLFRAVVEIEAKAVAAAIEADSQDPVDALDAFTRGGDAYFRAMKAPGRARLLLIDGPVVLGPTEMARIDALTGGDELLQGLQYAAENGDIGDVPLEPLAELLSAAFDKAALQIANGKPAAPYKRAVTALLTGLLSPRRSE